MICDRDNRDMSRTCADQCDRDNRDTPLGGVTSVTLVATELAHDWTASHPRQPRRCKGAWAKLTALRPQDRTGPVSRSPAIQVMGASND